ERSGDIRERDDIQHAPITQQILKSFLDVRPNILLIHTLFRGRQLHKIKIKNKINKTKSIDEKTPGDADPRHDDSAQGRPQNLRKIKERRLKADRVEQVFLRHQAVHQRLTRRLVDRVHDAEKEGQNRYVPKLN